MLEATRAEHCFAQSIPQTRRPPHQPSRTPSSRRGRCGDRQHQQGRSGAAAQVPGEPSWIRLSHEGMVPPTLGSFLWASRSPARQGVQRRCSRGRGPSVRWPGSEPMTIDVDSTICPVHGATNKAPLSATPGCSITTHCSHACGNWRSFPRPVPQGIGGSGRGTERFVRELVGLVRQAGWTGPITLSCRLVLLLPPRRESLPEPRCLLLDHRTAERRGQKGNRGNRRGGLGSDRLPRFQPGLGGRDHLWRQAPLGRASDKARLRSEQVVLSCPSPLLRPLRLPLGCRPFPGVTGYKQARS